MELVFSDLSAANKFSSDIARHVESNENLAFVDVNGTEVDHRRSDYMFRTKLEWSGNTFPKPVLASHYDTRVNPDSPPDNASESTVSRFASDAVSATNPDVRHLRVENDVVENFCSGRLQLAHIFPAAACELVSEFRYLDTDSSARKFNRLALTHMAHELFDGTNKGKLTGMNKENMPKMSFEPAGEPRDVRHDDKDFYELRVTAAFVVPRRTDSSGYATPPRRLREI